MPPDGAFWISWGTDGVPPVYRFQTRHTNAYFGGASPVPLVHAGEKGRWGQTPRDGMIVSVVKEEEEVVVVGNEKVDEKDVVLLAPPHTAMPPTHWGARRGAWQERHCGSGGPRWAGEEYFGPVPHPIVVHETTHHKRRRRFVDVSYVSTRLRFPSFRRVRDGGDDGETKSKNKNKNKKKKKNNNVAAVAPPCG